MLNIFLDLEGTVIDEFKEFPTFLPSKCEDIRKFLAPLKLVQPQSVFIFSFAIHTAEDEEVFNRTMLAELNNRLDCQVTGVVRVKEMFAVSKLVRKVRFDDVTEFILLVGKEGAFHDWCHLNHLNQFSFLIDDVVPNRATHDHDHGTTITTMNVVDLFRPAVRLGQTNINKVL